MFRVGYVSPAIGLWLALSPALVGASPQTPAQEQAAPAAGEKPICPVMLEEVEDPASAPYSDYRGKRYYFCCPACKPKFDKNPRKYVRALEAKQRRRPSA